MTTTAPSTRRGEDRFIDYPSAAPLAPEPTSQPSTWDNIPSGIITDNNNKDYGDDPDAPKWGAIDDTMPNPWTAPPQHGTPTPALRPSSCASSGARRG